MVPGYIFFFIFALMLYAYINHSQEGSATASAIRQIFSGPCQLSCRNDDDGISGFSGQQDTSGRHREVTECVCDHNCPCGLIDDFLKTCRPATQMYNSTINSISNYFLNFVETLQDAYSNVCRVMECGTSCQQRRMHINPTVYQAATDLPQDSEEMITVPQDNIISYTKDHKPDESTSVAQGAIQISESTETLKPWPENAVKSCSSCVEKGNICIRGCPKAVKKKD